MHGFLCSRYARVCSWYKGVCSSYHWIIELRIHFLLYSFLGFFSSPKVTNKITFVTNGKSHFKEKNTQWESQPQWSLMSLDPEGQLEQGQNHNPPGAHASLLSSLLSPLGSTPLQPLEVSSPQQCLFSEAGSRPSVT